MGIPFRIVSFLYGLDVCLSDASLDAGQANATQQDGVEVRTELATASVRGVLSLSGVSVLSWHSTKAEAPVDLIESVFPGMLSLDLDDEPGASGADSVQSSDSAGVDGADGADADDNRWKARGAALTPSEQVAVASDTDFHEAEAAPMTMAERLKHLRAQRVAEAEGISSVAGGSTKAAETIPTLPTRSSSGEAGESESDSDSESELLSKRVWASSADIDSSSNYSHPRPNETLDVGKIAWLHFPKAGTSFANTLVSWGCPDLAEQDIVDNRTADGSGAYIWGFMGTHKKQCHEEFSICGGHAPIKEGGCNAWEKHQGNFVALFRQPEQRIISGFNQNCHDIAGDNCTVTGYAKKVAGCSVKMMNGQDCGSDVAVTADMVTTAIQRLDTGFAFVGLTEQWALSVCLFHAMFGGQCHDREFLNVRPGKKHAVMRYDTQGLEGWTDAYDGAVYSHASTIFRNNIARYGVSPDTCRQDFCSSSAEAFETALFTEQR